MKKYRGIIWGTFFIIGAILVLANAFLGFMPLSPMVCCIIALPLMIEGFISSNFFGFFIPPAIILTVFSEEVGLKEQAPYILIASILISIGLTAILRKPSARFGKVHLEKNMTFEDVTNDDMSCCVNFGASTKYIRSQNFEKAQLSCKFGALSAYFDETTLSPNGAVLYVDVQFGAVEIYIPKTWRVLSEISAFLGGVDEKGKNLPEPNSPVLTIKGNVCLAGVEIRYV